jgi:hypothetical protein
MDEQRWTDVEGGAVLMPYADMTVDEVVVETVDASGEGAEYGIAGAGPVDLVPPIDQRQG